MYHLIRRCQVCTTRQIQTRCFHHLLPMILRTRYRPCSPMGLCYRRKQAGEKAAGTYCTRTRNWKLKLGLFTPFEAANAPPV